MPPTSPYSDHPAVAHTRAILENLPNKTGKAIEAWLAILEAQAPAGKKERMAWLKTEHGLGRDTAMVIVEHGEGETYDALELVEGMFAGPKAGLRPIYEALLKAGLALGGDIKACPCSTYVPLMRKRQFAVLKPTTRTRLDVGLALSGVEPTGRLQLAKGLGSDRITHALSLSALEDLDGEVLNWLRLAYERDL